MYFSNCAVGVPNKRLVILITYDKSTFLANNGQYQAWLKKDDAFLQSKKRKKGKIILDFLLPWKCLNLFYL